MDRCEILVEAKEGDNKSSEVNAKVEKASTAK